MNEPLKAELHSLFSFDIYPVASSEQNTGVKLVMARFYLNVPFEESLMSQVVCFIQSHLNRRRK
ncbi:hypothetical protein ACT6PN_003630 [Escherichia coli]